MVCSNCETLAAESEARLDRVLDMAARLTRSLERERELRRTLRRIKELTKDHETLDDDIKAYNLTLIDTICNQELD